MHLFDHDAGEVAMLEWSVDGVLCGQIGCQFQVEFVELVDFLQRQLHLASPVSWHKPGGPRMLNMTSYYNIVHLPEEKVSRLERCPDFGN